MRKAPLGLLLLSIPAMLAGCSAGNSADDLYGTATGATTGTTTGASGDAGTTTGTSAGDTGTTTGTSTGDTGPIPGSELCGTTLQPISGGLSGKARATRYWDCCLPHCAWPSNTSNTSKVCTANNEPSTLTMDEWGTPNMMSICDGGDGATCYDQAPWSACEDLAFAYAAVKLGQDRCGQCYELTFDGSNYDVVEQQQYNPDATLYPDPGSEQLAGKKMIVMASNTGNDVSHGGEYSQFDLMIPGGGVGIFPQGCEAQWGSLGEDVLGPAMGGMRTKCQQELNENVSAQTPLATIQECVKNRCDLAFGGDPNRQHLLDGCYFYVDWMGAANNPTFSYQEVECPQVLLEKY